MNFTNLYNFYFKDFDETVSIFLFFQIIYIYFFILSSFWQFLKFDLYYHSDAASE